MPNCLFDQCCGCIELRTGCLIIGYLNLIGSTTGLSISVIAAVKIGAFLNKRYWDLLTEAEQSEVTAAFIFMVVIVCILVALFAMSVTFLVGIHQGKRGHVKAFLVYLVIFLVICFIKLCFDFAQNPIDAVTICSLVFNILLTVYFFLVIRSYYFKMNDGSHQPAIYNTA